MMGHTSDRKADLSQVEFAAKNTPTNLFYNILKCLAILRQNFSIIEWKSTVFVSAFLQSVIVM
jgi:hypothetical protein